MDSSELGREYARYLETVLLKVDLRAAKAGHRSVREVSVSSVSPTSCGNRQLDMFLAQVAPFEARLGCNRFWRKFKKMTMQFYVARRDSIIRCGVDLPLVVFEARSCKLFRTNPFGLGDSSLNQNNVEWVDSRFIVGSRGFSTIIGGVLRETPYSDVVSVGRQIYWKFKDGVARELNAIDLMEGDVVNTLVLDGEPDVVADILKHIRFMLKEYCRLNETEEKILWELHDLRTVDYILSKAGDVGEAQSALKRLRGLGYVDEYNIITADGIVALKEYSSAYSAPP